jgi:hypothetical protein
MRWTSLLERLWLDGGNWVQAPVKVGLTSRAFSSKPSSRRPHKPTFLSALKEAAARAEAALPACRLHAGVRRRPPPVVPR